MMVGHSMTRWHWGTAEGTAEPAIPWDAHLFPDGTPVSFTEAAALRNYTTGVNDFLAFAAFLSPSLDAPEAWLQLNGDQRHTIGADVPFGASSGALYELAFWPCLSNATLRLTIGSAPGFTFSIDADPLTQTLVTGVSENGTAGTSHTYDIAKHGKPEGGMLVGAWNMLRVLIEPATRPAEGTLRTTDGTRAIGGGRIRVWFNPQFPDVTGGSVAPAGRALEPMPPRLDFAVDAPVSARAGQMEVAALGANAGVRVDYMSILPPTLYGLAAEQERVAQGGAGELVEMQQAA